jgi:hypothetical protein
MSTALYKKELLICSHHITKKHKHKVCIFCMAERVGFLLTRRAQGLALLLRSRALATTATGQSVKSPSNPTSAFTIPKFVTNVTNLGMAERVGFPRS